MDILHKLFIPKYDNTKDLTNNMRSIYKLLSFDDLLNISEKLYNDGYCYEYDPNTYPTHKDFLNKVKDDMIYQLSAPPVIYHDSKFMDVVFIDADSKTHMIKNIQIKGFTICCQRFAI